MPDDDLDQIRAHYVTLRDIIILNPGGWDDAESRARVEQLCRGGMAALPDGECQQHLVEVEAQAAQLYSRDGHHRWSRRTMSGADYLRLQILISLDALNARLFLVESLRRRERASLRQPGEDGVAILEHQELPAPGH